MTGRRAFLIGAGAAALAPTPRAEAQARRRYVLGYLANADPASTPGAEALRAELRARGWIEGQTIAIEYRWTEGRLDPELAVELARLNVDLIFVWGTPAVRAARQATSTIPIVMVGVGDPIGVGVIASLARPGGNVTGVSNLAREVSGKRLELLREAVPTLTRVGVLRNPVNPFSALQLKELEPAARALGVALQVADVRDSADFGGAFDSLARGRVGGVLLLAEPMFVTRRRELADLALKHRLPSIAANDEFVREGGLLSYGLDQRDMFRLGATYVDRILRGASPSDLPVAQATKLDLGVNRKTAAALGIKVPPSFLLRAGTVIE